MQGHRHLQRQKFKAFEKMVGRLSSQPGGGLDLLHEIRENGVKSGNGDLGSKALA